MKGLLLALLLGFTTINGFSQNQQIDRMRQELADAQSDTIRVRLMNSICNSLSGINPDSALFYGESALALARKINYTSGEIMALSYTSGVLTSTGNLPKALSMAFEALQLAERHNLEKSKKWPFIFISSVYKALEDFPKAIYFRKNALKIAEASSDTTSMRIENLRLAGLYIDFDKLDSATLYLNESLTLNKGNDNAEIFHFSGDIQAKQGAFLNAMDFYNRAAKMTAGSDNHRANSRLFMSIARLYENINQPDSSIYFAKKALEVSQLIQLKSNIIEASLLLSELYETVSDKESYYYYKLAATTKESLFGAGNIQAIQEMISQEEERQKEVERAKALYQNQLKLYGLILGVVFLVILAFIFFLNYKKQKGSNTILRQQKEEIQQTLSLLRSTQSQLIQSEKMASLGELTAGIAHEIQNPLNFVNNFSEVSTELVDEMNIEIEKGNNEEAKQIALDLKQNLEKINHHGKRAGDIVKGMLQHSCSSSGLKEPTDINALADEYLRLAYHGLRAKDKTFIAKFETDFDASLPKINVVSQDIGRVILNLINNAFYAVNTRANNEQRTTNNEPYTPTVIVSTGKVGDRIEILVSDNGTGIPDSIKEKIFQPFFTTKPTGQGTGLGLSLSYDIVKAHGGELRVETKEARPPARPDHSGGDESVGREEGLPAGQAGSVFIIVLPMT